MFKMETWWIVNLCVVVVLCESSNIVDNFIRLEILGVRQASAGSMAVRSVRDCCVLCSRFNWCYALTYHDNTCHMYASALSTGTRLSLSSKHFWKVKGYIGSACTENDDCHVVKSVCFNGTCKCVPGYNYNPRDDTCLRRCTKYGNSMSLYPGLAIAEHNEITKMHMTIQECVKACVSEANFLCQSVDMFHNDGMCHLHAVGYLDVDKIDRERGQTNWIYMHRDCAV